MSDSHTPEPLEEQDDSEISDLEVSETAAQSVRGGEGVATAPNTVPKFTAGSQLTSAMRQ